MRKSSATEGLSPDAFPEIVLLSFFAGYGNLELVKMAESIPIILKDNHQFETAVSVRKPKTELLTRFVERVMGKENNRLKGLKKAFFESPDSHRN